MISNNKSLLVINNDFKVREMECQRESNKRKRKRRFKTFVKKSNKR